MVSLSLFFFVIYYQLIFKGVDEPPIHFLLCMSSSVKYLPVCVFLNGLVLPSLYT